MKRKERERERQVGLAGKVVVGGAGGKPEGGERLVMELGQ